MKKLFILSLAVVVLFFLGSTNISAEPSGKLIWNVGDVKISPDSDDWQNIFKNSIKITKQETKDLIIDVSLECGITTNTRVVDDKSPHKSEATVEVLVRVYVDDEIAQPEKVTFAKRFQALVSKKEPLTKEDNIVTFLDTKAANSFKFVMEDVPGGTHNIVVQAKVSFIQDGLFCGGHPKTNVSIGNGLVAVESVKMIKGMDTVPEL